MGSGAVISLITSSQSVWLFLVAVLCFMTVWFVIWVETRRIRWQLKFYKRKIFEILRNINKYEQPRYDHNASKIGIEIEEFYTAIANQIVKSFKIEKEFTQNASHELQTPITVINTAVESLIQSPNLNEHDYKNLDVILTNTKKVSRINQALVLLSRIKSYHNVNVEPIAITPLVDSVLRDFVNQIEMREIAVNKEYESDLKFNMNSALCEILFTNLISNAVKHNLSEGNITIRINTKRIIITNTGKTLQKQPNELFERFSKDGNNPDSLGLGLSIVKLICEYSNLNIGYYHKDGIHEMIVSRNR